MALHPRSKKRIVANGISILVVALVMWLYTNNQRAKEQRSSLPETTHTLKVALDLSPNGIQVDSLGNLTGKQSALLNLLLPSQDRELVPFASRTEALEALVNGKVQLYATSMPYSSVTRLEGIEATEWLYASHFSLLFHKDNGNWQSRFLSDTVETITVSKEDQAAVTILENLAELTYPNLQIDIREMPPLQLGVELSKGNITYLMCDSDIAQSIVEVDSTLQLSHDVGFDLHQVWLVGSKETKLKAQLDSAIVALRGSSEWSKIINSNK